jgi:hypothetical protein
LIVNLEPTHFDERADVALHARAGEAMKALVARLA